MKMRVLIGYDGSESADAALEDLRRAGLPREVEALIVSVGEVLMPPSSVGHEVSGPPLTSRRLTVVLAQAEAQAAQKLKEVKVFAAKAGDRLQSSFPDWEVQDVGLAGSPSAELINKADEWKADLVVVGSHGRSALGRFILGSVSKKVVTDSHHSVRVARGTVKKKACRRR
jgi:nucleotide-binding universal stress UspA family protein